MLQGLNMTILRDNQFYGFSMKFNITDLSTPFNISSLEKFMLLFRDKPIAEHSGI